MLHRFAPGFAESQEGRPVLLRHTFYSLRWKRVVSRCWTGSAGQRHSARWTVPLLTPTLPRGSGLSDSGSVCAESASSRSVPENASNIVNFILVESSRIYRFSDFSWILMCVSVCQTSTWTLTADSGSGTVSFTGVICQTQNAKWATQNTESMPWCGIDED